MSNSIEELKCNVCQKIKPISEYSKHKSKLGYKLWCKKCVARYFRERYYPANSDKVKLKNETYRKSNWSKLKKAAYSLQKKSPEKKKARLAVNNAVLRGKFDRDACQVCDEIKTDFHHTKGYSEDNWFVGVWLCRKHHAELHKELRWQTT